MPLWNIQYVYLDKDGKTSISVDQVEAANETKARDIASANAPAGDFVVSVHPLSEEQILGEVRRQAMILAGGSRGGRLRSHKWVRLLYGCPYSYGWTVQDGFGSPNTFMGVGFSTAIRGTGASNNSMKNSLDSIPFRYRSGSNSPLG